MTDAADQPPPEPCGASRFGRRLPRGDTLLDTLGQVTSSLDGARLRIFDSHDAPAASAILDFVAEGVADVDLAAPAVVLPDFHHKSSMEMPSSIAVATRQTIRPTFTSASVNCGMALIAMETEIGRAHV